MSAKLEIERKFIIQMPDIRLLETKPEYTKSDIVQIYLTSPRAITHRIRSRDYGERTVYTETVKIRQSNMSAHEDEKEIDKRLFDTLKEKIAEGTVPLIKTRHTFCEGGYTYEIDIYPRWKSTCIMEVELENEGEEAPFPDIIRTVREVTGIKMYSNASMARCFPDEEKINT